MYDKIILSTLGNSSTPSTSSMRIISGKYKKKQIHPPTNLRVRPTTDIANEALFNVLSNNWDFQEIKVLDLFAGTGNISYEFASRGCEDITAIEMNFRNFLFIKKRFFRTLSALALYAFYPKNHFRQISFNIEVNSHFSWKLFFLRVHDFP